MNSTVNTREDYLLKRTVSDYEDKDYNLRNFDYSKKICTSEFRYQWNTKRDLILSGGSYDFAKISEENPYLLESIVRSATINRASAPRCQIVFVLFNSRNIEIFAKRVERINVTIYEDTTTSAYQNQDYGAVNRFHYFKNYLINHRSEYDRVFFVDSRDVVMFTDAFGTIDQETVHFVAECHSNRTDYCNTFGNNQYLREWIGFYGYEIEKKFVSENNPAVNCGIFYGPIEKMIQVFDIIDNETMKLNIVQWGVDTAVLNYCFYMGLFKNIKNVLHHCSNLVCFGPSDIHYFPKNKSLYQYVDGKLQCAPIIVHGTEYLQLDFPVLYSYNIGYVLLLLLLSLCCFFVFVLFFIYKAHLVYKFPLLHRASNLIF